MDIGKNFTFITEDEAWIKKVIIGGLAALIFGLPLMGYIKQMFKNVIAGEEKPLPEWDNFGGYLIEGLKLLVVIIGYELALFVVYGGAVAINIAAAASGVKALSYVGLGCSCLAIPVAIVVGILMPSATMRFFATDSIGAAFQVGEVFGFIKANIGQYLLALVMMVVCIFLGELGVIGCGVGVLFTMPYMMMVAWKNFADVYRNAAQPQAEAA